MELRDFAEQVLFATTLEEKLRCPAVITDERPGAAFAAPEAPGRPAGLKFKAQGSGKAEFPGTQRLEDTTERGRLLHFFANHELLATELMALVLLRFPAAPVAFRRGVLQTLKDEQEHTRLYLVRMEECGIGFGELPVSGYFWRSVAPMESPLDFVAGLSLTFEQANLDFARHFARGFATVGDTDSAALLDRIYRDEIGHVAHGLRWFRRWKNPDESDWEAFCRQLKFPLSPQRAKGVSLNVEGRRAAGLDPAFIAELDVYSASKGRTPGVFVFNPFTEGFLAHGPTFMPVKAQAQLARDLANLPQFLARQDDLVLVPQRPSVEFLSGLKRAGFPLPEFVEMEGSAGLRPGVSADLSKASPMFREVLECASPLALSCGEMAGTAKSGRGLPQSKTLPRPLHTLAQRKLGRLRPWAWGPDSLELLGPLFANVTDEARPEAECFNAGIAPLYSKAWSADFLRRFLSSRSSRGDEALNGCGVRNAECGAGGQSLLASAATEDWLCTEHEVGVAVDTLDEALTAIAAIRTRGHHKVVVKEAFGLAGSNSIRLWEPALLETQRRWLANALTKGRRLVVEPWLERVVDFSVQLEMGADGLRLVGYTGLANDRKGQFQANWAAPDHSRRLPSSVAELFRDRPEAAARLPRFYPKLLPVLEAELRRVGYRGPLGLDAFVYRTPEGDCRLKPIVEINPRHTMGRLTLELMKRVAPGSSGRFSIVSLAQARAEGAADFAAYARSLGERFPLRLEGEPAPKLREGTVVLNDPAEARGYLAVFQVSREAQNTGP